MHPTPSLIYLLSATACGGAAAVTDLRSRRIPNRLTVPAMLLGVGLHLALGGLRGAGSSVAAGLLAGALFFVFFAAGGMGAGDVKLMAAVGFLVGLPPLRGVLILTALGGAVLAVVLALAKRQLTATVRNSFLVLEHHGEHGLQPHPELNVGNGNLLRLPYAVPISSACVTVLLLELCGGISL